MRFNEFEASLRESQPPVGLSVYLSALWYDARGDWSKAHEIVQEVDTSTAAQIHAFLHRKEGDESNAKYWYRAAERPFPSDQSLEEEWRSLVDQLL